MDYQNDSRHLECIVKTETPDQVTDVLEEGALEEIGKLQQQIVMKGEDGVSGEDIVDIKVDQTNMESTVTDSVALLKMECPDEDIFEDTKINIKLEETTFGEMDVSDCNDFKEDVIVNAIKQEELIIKTEFDEPCGDNINCVKRHLDSKPLSRSSSQFEDESTVVSTSNCTKHDLEIKRDFHLKSHKKQSKNVVLLSCGECGHQTKYKSYLKRHMLRHKSSAEIEMFSCVKCDYQAKVKDDLKAHMLRHKSATEIEMFSCGMCDFQTKYKRSLNIHILRHKRATELVIFSCGECNYQTSYKKNLKRHELRHKAATEVEMFPCDECDFQTKYKEHLKKHKLRHVELSGMEMFSCGECNYQTSNKKNLKKHEFRHKADTEVEIFRCCDCDFQTRYKKHLKKHKLRHE